LAQYLQERVDHVEFKKEVYPSGRFTNVSTTFHVVVMIKCDKVVVLDTDVLIRNDMDDQLLRCISFGAVGTAGAMRQGEVAGQHLEPNPT
jgi:alpha-N-acetylglucosamine transferase